MPTFLEKQWIFVLCASKYKTFYLSLIQQFEDFPNLNKYVKDYVVLSLDERIVNQKKAYLKSAEQLQAELMTKIDAYAPIEEYLCYLGKSSITILKQLLYAPFDYLIENVFDGQDFLLLKLESDLERMGFHFAERSYGINYEKTLVQNIQNKIMCNSHYDTEIAHANIPICISLHLMRNGIYTLEQLFESISSELSLKYLNLERISNYLTSILDDYLTGENNIETLSNIKAEIKKFLIEQGVVVKLGSTEFVIPLTSVNSLFVDLSARIYAQKCSIGEIYKLIEDDCSLNSLINALVSKNVIKLTDIPLCALTLEQNTIDLFKSHKMEKILDVFGYTLFNHKLSEEYFSGIKIICSFLRANNYPTRFKIGDMRIKEFLNYDIFDEMSSRSQFYMEQRDLRSIERVFDCYHCLRVPKMILREITRKITTLAISFSEPEEYCEAENDIFFGISFSDCSWESDNKNVKQLPDNILDMTLEELDLSGRTTNYLYRANIKTVRDVVSKTEDQLECVRNLGRKGFEEVRNKLCDLGLSFRETEDEELFPYDI